MIAVGIAVWREQCLIRLETFPLLEAKISSSGALCGRHGLTSAHDGLISKSRDEAENRIFQIGPASFKVHSETDVHLPVSFVLVRSSWG